MTDPRTPPALSNACCAHLVIRWQTRREGQFTCGWWECDTCHLHLLNGHFGESPLPAAPPVAEGPAATPRPYVVRERNYGLDNDDAFWTVEGPFRGVKMVVTCDDPHHAEFVCGALNHAVPIAGGAAPSGVSQAEANAKVNA